MDYDESCIEVLDPRTVSDRFEYLRREVLRMKYKTVSKVFIDRLCDAVEASGCSFESAERRYLRRDMSVPKDELLERVYAALVRRGSL